MLPAPTSSWQRSDFEAATELAHRVQVPTAVYCRFDSWDDPARAWRGEPGFADLVHQYCEAATLVAGPQLPVVGGPARKLALPYPPMMARLRQPPSLEGASLDVQFAGAYRDPGWAGPPSDTRDRHHRGRLLACLRATRPANRLSLRYAVYWDHGERARSVLRQRATEDMDRATMVLAPAGWGHLTFRHSDGWARGRVVLSEPLQEHTLVPEPDRWRSSEIVLTYDPSGADLAEVVECRARRSVPSRRDRRAGWDYGRRWTEPAAQVRLLAQALADLRR